MSRRRALGIGGAAVAGGAIALAADARSAGAASGSGAMSINVKDPGFGAPAAAGDGSADDADAVQAAVNLAAFLGGGTVFFPAGRYRVSRTVALPSGVHLEGEGGLKDSGSWAGVSEVFASVDASVFRSEPQGVQGSDPGTSGIRLQDLSIRGFPGTATSISRGAVCLRNTNGAVIDGCSINGGGIAALELTGGQNVVRHSRIGGDMPVRYGIYCDDYWSENGLLVDSLIADNDQVTTGRGAVSGFGGHGIRLGAGSANNIIANNFIFFCDHGIYDAGSTGDVIVGNRIDMNLRSGICLTGPGEHAITGNSFHTNGAVAGIADDQRAGVRITGSGGASVVCGNVFRNWDAYTGTADEDDKLQQYGVVLVDSTHDNAITGNSFVRQGLAGILDLSSQASTNLKSGNGGQA